MKFSNFSWTGLLVGFLIVVGVTVVGMAIGIPLYNQHQIELKYPVGCPVTLKGLHIKGNVNAYIDSGVRITVLDDDGQLQFLTVDQKLLSK